MLWLFSMMALSNFGQSSTPNLLDKFKDSDSVIIVSHESLYKRTPEGIEFQQILINGVPNSSLIIEKKLLTKKYIKSLGTTLSTHKPVEPGGLPESSGCFDPHHAIFIYKNGICFCMDICFSCTNYRLTEQLVVPENMLGSHYDWDNLKQFFKNQGITYGYDID